MALNFIDLFTDAPVRRLPSSEPLEKKLYLTFDDGPDKVATPKVLKILNDKRTKATFFFVAEKAKKQPSLLSEIQREGHAIGNHSLDHQYFAFFQGRKVMANWIEKSERIFEELGIQSVGFRPPVGIVTPELVWALRQKGIPLILWAQRFYDTRFHWSEKRAAKSLNKTASGDIVLLHDSAHVSWLNQEKPTLISYIDDALAIGFQLVALPLKPASE